jgi:CDP-6-deoxy-D-xylo-4-hexulose-3-dehydrase
MDAPILSMNFQCKKFEEKFSNFQSRKYSVFVSSGSMANLVLIQSLLNLGMIKRGAKVGVSSLTWATNIMPLIQLGLKPVLIDCDNETLNVSLRNIEKEYEQSPFSCLFLTNALGFCSDIDNIKDFCQENRILFIEDNCESLGSEYKKIKLGNFGEASTFSFFVGHHLSTIEGGMICTDNENLYHMLLMTRAHGWSRNLPEESKSKLKKDYAVNDFYDKYMFYDLAYNARPTEINGFIGNIQIDYIDEIIDRRERNFFKFYEYIDQNPVIEKINYKNLSRVSNFGVPLVFKNREIGLRYRESFERNNIEIRPIISGSMHKQPFYQKYVANITQNFPNAEKIHENGFYFGNNPELNESEIKRITDILES